ncbi:solute carrier family 2, facilitated glucose transporter member 8 [Sylvia borin]
MSNAQKQLLLLSHKLITQPDAGCPSAGSRHGLHGLPEPSTAGCFPAAIAPTAGPALSTSAARATICGQPRQKGHPPDETRTSRPPGAEGRGEGGAEPARGEPLAPERRRSRTRRSHNRAASGASQRHQSPPPRSAASVRLAPAARRRLWRRPAGEAARDGCVHTSHRRDMAAEESRCLLGYVTSDSYRFTFAWGPAPWLLIPEVFLLKARGKLNAACMLSNWVMAFLGTQRISGFYIVESKCMHMLEKRRPNNAAPTLE